MVRICDSEQREPRNSPWLFSFSWEQREFEKSFSLLQNNTLSRAELSESSGVAANIHYGDVLIKFGEYLDMLQESFPWIKKQADADKFRTSFLQDGDIVFADTAEDETAGKCCEIRNCGSTVIISGLHTIPCRPVSKFAPGYLGYYLNSAAFHEQLVPLMQGTKVVSISKAALESTLIQYPSDDKEQQKIGALFRGIDRLITLHQCKYFYSSPKSGIFHNEKTNAWEQRELNQAVTFFNGQTYTPADVVAEEGTLVLRSSNVQDGEISLTDNVYVNDKVVNVNNVNVGDIIVVVRNGSKALIGKHAQIKFPMQKTVIGAFMTGIRSHNPTFINALLSTQLFANEVEKNMGATINQITGWMFKKMSFSFPKNEEQQKIGSLFRALDDLITLHQREYLLFEVLLC